jgi:hypothetical protein
MDRRANNECPDCGDPYLYAVEEGRTGVLYVHGFQYFEELGDLVKEGCHVPNDDGVQRGEQTVERELEESEFYLDMFPGETFHGYTSGDTWNGWACPLFPKGEADRIAEAFDGLEHPYDGSEHRAAYDEEGDTFVFYEPTSDSYEAFRGIDVEGTTLYPIGTYAWSWSEVDPKV